MRYFIQLLPGLLTLWAAAEGSEIYNDFCATMIFSDDSTIGDFSSLKTNMQNNIPVSILMSIDIIGYDSFYDNENL